MFTGLVQGVGRIVQVAPQADGLRVAVDALALGTDGIGVGDSIAVNGCCLTVVAVEGAHLSFDVSAATLACTTGIDRPGAVNLEKALRFGDRLGGHLMAGHVDGIGVVRAFERAGAGDGSVTATFEAPAALARFIASKGSIAVDGVSLTVNAVEGACFAVNLIPHTLAVTTLGALAPGARVNLEVDLIARYIARMLEARDGNSAPS
jgi:riboflavin synthase